jgi:hypothetical protein
MLFLERASHRFRPDRGRLLVFLRYISTYPANDSARSKFIGTRGQVVAPVTSRIPHPPFRGRDVQAEEVCQYRGGKIGGEGHERGVPDAA